MNAARRACDSDSSAPVFMSTPMRRTCSTCCARAAIGHATAAPPSSVMNSRRFSLGKLPPVPHSHDQSITDWSAARTCRSAAFRSGRMSAPGQSLPSHDGLKSCDVRCWSDSCQKIAGPRIQRSVFAAAKQPRHSIKSATQTDTSYWRNGKLWNVFTGLGSVRLDARELDHLGPLFSFIGNELAEVGGRTAQAP